MGRHGVVDAVGVALGELAALLLPVACPGCGAPDVAVCARCRAALLGGPLHVAPPTPGSPPVLAATRYDPVVSALVVAAKDRGRHDLLPVLADALVGPLGAALVVVRDHVGRHPLVVPVPSAAAARRRRGGDHVTVMAARALRSLDAQASRHPQASLVPTLRQRRGVGDQVGLGAHDRAANLRGALRVGHPRRVQGRVCVLVDDVVTTGATLAAATAALRDAGAVVPVAVVVAATARRHG